MKIKVKDAIADILLQEKVDYVFGYTGGHIMHMFEAVNNAGISIIFNKQEWNAVYMADWYTRVSKKIGVILATAGPWATNMLTWLATAYLDSIPLIAIWASVETYSVWRNPIQDGSWRWRSIDQKGAFKAVCKQSILPQCPEEIPNSIREAFRIALSWRPGPVYIEIPSDYWNLEIDYEVISSSKYKNLNFPSCNLNDCEKILNALYEAEKPFIVIWEWAEEEFIKPKLKDFLDNIKIPFWVSPIAKNFVDEFNSYYLGVMRSSGKTQKIYEYMRESDFILFLGDRMQEWEMNWHDESLIKNKKLAQIDIDYDEIGRVYPVDYSAVWSISSFVDFVKKTKHKNFDKLLKYVSNLKDKFPRKDIYLDSNKWLNPMNMINIVEKLTSKDSSIVCDTWNTKSLTILKFRTNLNQNFLTADNNWPMGYSVPASLGAALATKKEVVCFVWDWGFQMSLNELGLCLNYDLKVIYIIHNNNGCDSIKRYHTSIYWHHCVAGFVNPDYLKIAKAYNMEWYTVKTSDEFESAFKKAKESKKSVIIESIVDDSLIVWE